MEQPGIPTYILITAIGVVMLAGFLLLSVWSGYRRFPVQGGGRVTEPAPSVPAARAPVGSMAARRQHIEELLQRKEGESQDS